MKNFLKGLIVVVGLFTGCSGANDKVTGSKSLTEEVTGKYARSLNFSGKSSYDGQPFTSFLKDTIIVIQKDNGFEIQNHYWKKTVNKNGKSSDSNGEYGKGETFQGTFNKIDTTISSPLGGSIKINTQKGQLFATEHPDIIFSKVK